MYGAMFVVLGSTLAMMESLVAELVVKAFAGREVYQLDYIGGRPLHKDARWDEIARVPIPEGMGLAEAAEAYQNGRLARPAPSPAAERAEKRDRNWEIKYPGPAFPTRTEDSKRDMDWEHHRPKAKKEEPNPAYKELTRGFI